MIDLFCSWVGYGKIRGVRVVVDVVVLREREKGFFMVVFVCGGG